MSVLPKKHDQNEIMLLWDESHIWGLMLWRSLCLLGLPPQVIRSQEICQGILSQNPPKLLIVPGGWASRKALSLKDKGRSEIRNFIQQNQGTYLGLCGGAGLALSNGNNLSSLGLCPWTRKPLQQRLPNCSGHIYIDISQDLNLHPKNKIENITAPIWWPSQFDPQPGNQVDIVASYQNPSTDFWVADLPVFSLPKDTFSFWEDIYNINLDPENLRGEPCLVKGVYGQGKYLLSYLHLETPASPEANNWLHDLISSLINKRNKFKQPMSVPEWDLKDLPIYWQNQTLIDAKKQLNRIIESSQENFFLCWRKPWLLGWKRGFPGFAVNTLYALIAQSLSLPVNQQIHHFWDKKGGIFEETMDSFTNQFHSYLGQLRLNLNQALGPSRENLSIKLEEKKENLFGPFPGQDGLFGQLITIMQESLWLQIRQISQKKDRLELSSCLDQTQEI